MKEASRKRCHHKWFRRNVHPTFGSLLLLDGLVGCVAKLLILFFHLLDRFLQFHDSGSTLLHLKRFLEELLLWEKLSWSIVRSLLQALLQTFHIFWFWGNLSFFQKKVFNIDNSYQKYFQIATKFKTNWSLTMVHSIKPTQIFWRKIIL